MLKENENKINNSEETVELLSNCVESTIAPCDYIRENIIGMDIHNVAQDVVYDVKKFNEGVVAVSELCGKITALANCGIAPDMAFAYITGLEFEEIKNKANKDIANIQSKVDIERAKYGEVFNEKNMI